MSLKDKVAIVTGGNSGIGQAIVLELAGHGASIVIDYIVHPEATEAIEQQIAALGDQSIGVDADVSKLADPQKLVHAAVSKFGRVDIMVNNAGVETRTSVLDTTEGQYDRVMAITQERPLRHPGRCPTDDQAGWRRPHHQSYFSARGLADARQRQIRLDSCSLLGRDTADTGGASVPPRCVIGSVERINSGNRRSP